MGKILINFRELFTIKNAYAIIKKNSLEVCEMNQILYEDVQEKSKSISNVILFFAISIIIFGFALITGGAYGFFNQTIPLTPEEATKPTIYVSTYEDQFIQIRVSHDKAIDKIFYSWNNGEELTIDGKNRTNIEETIGWPAGENELVVRVVDINGVEQLYKQTFLLSYEGDIEKPTIKFSEPVDNKILITATDETEISYLTYRWNNEEEKMVEETDESKTIINVTIPIIEGENKLTVIAVDNNNNSTKEERTFKAYKKPTIQVRQFGRELQLTVIDENGIDNIQYSINGVENTWQATSGEKEWKQTLQLEPGENRVIITVINIKEISNTFKGKAQYNP